MRKIIVSVLLLAALIYAQSFQGSLRGRVVDPNGASVPVAKITISDEATNLRRTTVTNEQGEYAFAAVTPATYTVMAEAPGFKRIERHGIVASTQTAVTTDLAMELGQVNEQVNVTDDAPLLQTADASTGEVIDRQKI